MNPERAEPKTMKSGDLGVLLLGWPQLSGLALYDHRFTSCRDFLFYLFTVEGLDLFAQQQSCHFFFLLIARITASLINLLPLLRSPPPLRFSSFLFCLLLPPPPLPSPFSHFPPPLTPSSSSFFSSFAPRRPFMSFFSFFLSPFHTSSWTYFSSSFSFTSTSSFTSFDLFFFKNRHVMDLLRPLVIRQGDQLRLVWGSHFFIIFIFSCFFFFFFFFLSVWWDGFAHDVYANLSWQNVYLSRPVCLRTQVCFDTLSPFSSFSQSVCSNQLIDL